MKPGEFYLWVTADAGWRGQGVGTALYDDLLRFVRMHSADLLFSETRETCAEGLAFAQQRGFVVDRHFFESVLDLHTFDERRFAGIIAAVEASGIRLFSLADAGDTVEMRRRLWEVNYQTHLENPGTTGTFPSFEEMMAIWAQRSWFRADGQILAAAGEQVVGLSAVGYFETGNLAYNMMTGVLSPYRGRGIAQAMKLLAIRAARRWGVDSIRTHNDSQNGPMLAVNRKLGYVARPGVYRLKQVLPQGEPI
jgi:GNAT superfamily N-acetyltransferase